MRAGGRFGMVLHGKLRLAFNFNTLDGGIVQVNMGDLKMRCIPDCISVYGKAVVLCSDFAFAGGQVLHRVVQAPVAVVHFEGRDVVC